jgi:hypothetical protein
MSLTDLERDILDFAGTTWLYAGAREAAIRERFGLSATPTTSCSTACSTGQRRGPPRW